MRFKGWAINTFQILTFLLSLIGSLASVYSLYVGYQTQKQIHWLSFVLILILALLAVLYLFYRINTERNKLLECFSQSVHKLTHEIRNELYQLECMYESNKLNDEHINSRIKLVATTVVNQLESVMTAIIGKKVSVCIKHFDINKPWENDPKKWELKTLCRSTGTDQQRKDNDDKLIMVDRNTALIEILLEGNSAFAVRNLKKYKKSLESANRHYLNSTDKWDKYYNSTIVVPIRIASQLLPPSQNCRPSQNYHILGLLSMDSESSLNDSEMEFYTQIIFAYADELYKFFERSRHFMWRISSQEAS